MILLLCGGDKSTQQKDIKKAHQLATGWLTDKQKVEEKEDTPWN